MCPFLFLFRMQYGYRVERMIWYVQRNGKCSEREPFGYWDTRLVRAKMPENLLTFVEWP